jgi:serine protease inhibitor
MNRTACTLAAVLGLSGCGGSAMDAPVSSGSSGGGGGVSANAEPPAVNQALSEATPVDPAIVAADNDFGFALFQALLSEALAQNPNGNLAISPLSLAMALQITYNGAAGAAAQGMAQTLQLGSLGTSQLNNDNAALQASLISADPQVQVIVANSLWTHLDSDAVAPSFIQMDQTYYGAQISDLSGAPGSVNAWAAQETQGLITQILPAGDYSSLVALIANTIYFKGAWTSGFDANQTSPAAFTRSDGTQPMVPFMHQTEVVPYLQASNYQAVLLPYGQGHYSMLIVLPAGGVDFASFAASLTPQLFDAIAGQMQDGEGTLALPKFSASYSQNVVETLGTLGMAPALCPNNNALPQIGNGCISFVQHATVVDVDEAGTVAAAATAGGVGIVVTPRLSFTMTMDHPFLYAIRNNDDGEVLFIGALMDPSA